MGPLAKKLIAEIEKGKKLGRAPEVLQAIQRPPPIEVPKNLPPETFVWLKSYQYLSKIAAGIMGSTTLREFSETVRIADEEYLPYGPPDSPITDSFFFGWWGIDQPVRGAETIATIAADLAERYGGAEDEVSRLRVLAETQLRVVKIEARDGALARLRDLVTGEELEVGLAAPWDGEVGQLWLARALPDMCFTPYALDGEDAEDEWRAYFERQIGADSDAGRPARYLQHMRGDPPEHWLEYILAGYHEGTQHTLHLVGVPDRQESLPHAEEQLGLLFDADEEAGSARDLLVREMFLSDVALEALEDFMTARESFELEAIEPDEDTLLDPMLIGYACYGVVQENGETFLESFLKDPPPDLDPAELADLQATAAGWFSLFEIKHVKLDEGMELEDLLQKKTVWVEEKTATRQVGLGELLACWLQDHGGGRLTLEGSNLRFARMIAEPVRGLIKDYYGSLEDKGMSAQERLAAMAPILSAIDEAMAERPPIPTILNEDGEEMVFSQARYLVKGDVASRLASAGWSGETDSFALFDGEKLVASAELDGERMILFATSPAQLEKAKAAAAALLGADAVHQTDVFEDAQVAMAERMADDDDDDAPVEPLSPEMVAELRAHLEHELREWLDTPVPMLGDRTPRQAVKSKRGKDDVKMMLLEQERLLADQPQLEEPIDFRPLWESLGLEYPS